MDYIINKSAIGNGRQRLSAKASATNTAPSRLASPDEVQDLVCFSHLRWDCGYGRPQQLLSRASQSWRVWYVEETVWCETLRLDVRPVDARIQVVVPHLPQGIDGQTALRLQRQLINQFLEAQQLTDFIAWYYTPTDLLFTDHLQPRLTVYDCTDELSVDTSPSLAAAEERLMQRADLVYADSYRLYEAKQHAHGQLFAFPSCVDLSQFGPGRETLPDPDDQQGLTRPRLGYCGVIDERVNFSLLADLSQRQPNWQFILLGPVVGVDPAVLPQGPNLHYLGLKDYQELPAYFGNWQVALLPFAINGATRHIHPTRTSEYLAAGLPVASTPIRDVVRRYGGCRHVLIGDTAPAFEKAVALALTIQHGTDWQAVDGLLLNQSWDETWQHMQQLIDGQLQKAGTFP